MEYFERQRVHSYAATENLHERQSGIHSVAAVTAVFASLTYVPLVATTNLAAHTYALVAQESWNAVNFKGKLALFIALNITFYWASCRVV